MNTLDLIRAIKAGDSRATTEAFDQIMLAKTSDAIEARTQEVRSSMFQPAEKSE